ncbi:hypothetical protein IRJ41_006057 [Triplophysa rosa]|uniref:Myb-like domain-containing protein n=1 Tax=Triplophysa rosa TaxID=992332 RepID=A0A9W7X2M8_TRIRA|nr:hypothetical protein IRJ41_006057 [Triplophysa rosa]
MRRARISIKPNVRPGGRAVAPTAESKTSQEPAAVDNTQQTHTGEKIDSPSTSQQSHLEVRGPAVATGEGNVPGCPSEKASVNTGDGVPSSAITPAATALQRRSRISATPNLARPKVRSVPPACTGKNASLPSVPSKSSPEPPVPAATSRDDSQNSTLSDSILKQTNATINSTPSSPSREPSVQNTSPSSTQLQQELFHTPKKSRSAPQEAVSPSSSILSPCIKLSRCYGPGSPLKNSEMSDKQRVMRALKLKELMKLERRKVLMKRKSGLRMCEPSDEVDLSKMTLADFIYYLPETNPMKSSFSKEEAPAETVVPPSPKLPPKLAEPEEEDDDDDLMVPKVKVAEDGTLILDDDSLTVRVQRTSDTVVEDATPLFERGNTTTYMSFRKSCHVKNWSVRETDMFYLAISMVGTDFSMMAQLLTHRSRTEIKNKFKKEEKTNAWRVDKAFRNKRPFDNEFFSFLLKRVLEKDKKSGKSIKLVVKPNKANKGKGGKKGKKHEDQDIDDDIQDEVDIGDNDSLDLEKENEDSNNVKVSDSTSSTSKKRKRKRESEPKGSPGEKTCKRKKNKKKSKKGEESNSVQVENDSVNAENEDPSLIPISKKKRKRSRKGEEKMCEELEDKPKAKRNKKTVKVPDEESLDIDGENSQASIEHKAADTSKTCKRSKKCKEETAKGKRKTRKSKKSFEECTGDDLNDVSSEVSTAGPDAEKDQGDKPTLDTVAQEETPQHTSKRSKRPLPKIPKRKAKKCSVSNAQLEDEDAAPEGQDANCRKTDSEIQVDSLVDSQLQKQAVVVLERTPPRLIKTHGWSVSPDQSQTAESLQGSPGRQTRAEKAKRNLIGSERERNEMGRMDECQTASGSDTSADNMTMTTQACQDDTQESKTMEADQHMKGDFSIQTEGSTEVSDQMLLKRPLVMLFHEEVHHYLKVHTKTEENSSASESHLDAVSAKVKSVEEQMDCPVEKSASGATLEEVSQYPGMKESASTSPQQCIAQKRRRFTKPTPNLSRSQQTEEKPLNLQTTEYSEDNPDSLRSCPVEDTTTALNKCPASPEEHPTSSETLKEDFQDLRVNESNLDDIETTIDDDLSFTSDEEIPTVSTNVVQEILSFLERPNLPATLSNEETMTEEPLELTVPTSCFKQSTEGSQQNTEHHEDSASDIYDVGGYQSHVEAMHCELDLSMKKNITTEDKLVSYEANCKQAQDPLSPFQLLGPKQTIGPTVPLKDTFTDNKETSDAILTDVLIAPPDTCSQVSTEALGASFSEATTKYPSNPCDMNTMLFCETTTEDVQRSVGFSEENVNSMGKFQHSISDSVKEDKAENLSKADEEFSGNAKSDILDSAGVETGEEPTFILTLYEIPTSQLFQEASCSHQEILPYELQPAEVHTPHLFSSDSQSLPSTLEESSALLHMKSQETEKPCKSVSGKVEDDSSVVEDAVKYASKQQITSEKRSFDDEGSQEVLSYNDSVPTDVTGLLELGEKPFESTERKVPSQRRSKIKVKPNLRPCAKAGPSKTECASSQKHTVNINLPTSCDIAQHTETESNQKTSVQETIGSFVPNILSNPEESGRQPHHEGPLTASVPVSEDIQDKVPMSWGSPVKTDLQMDIDTAVDLSLRNFSDVPDLHSTAIEQSNEEVEEGCEGVSHVVLVDALVVASGEMEDKGDSDCWETSLTFNDQETFSDISEELDTYEEALNLTSTSQDRTELSESMLQVRPEINPETTCNKDESSRQEYPDVRSNQPAITQITLEPQIKKESDKGKEKDEQDDFSDKSKEDLGTPLNLTEEVLKQEQQLAQLASTCAETQSVEKTEDVSHVVLFDMFVAVSEENKDEVHMDSERSPLHLRQLCEDPCALEKEQNLTTDADQEVGEHEAVSHMVMADIFVPVSEEVEDGLGKEQMTIRKRSPLKAETSQVKERPLCAISKSTNMGPSLSPKRRMPSKKAEPHSTSTLKQQDICTLKRKKESNSEEIEGSTPFESESFALWQQTQCGVKTTLCAKSPSTDSTDIEEACEGVSHTVFSGIFVPVSDETTESSLHTEALMVSFQEPSEQVEELGDERPTNTDRQDLTESQSSEHDMASCRRVTQTAESLEHQAEEEWSLRSNILPIDSNEIENWCEGVSHMLLSDAFVPVSEEENNTDQKDVENAKSLPEYGRTSDNANKEHQVDSISDTQKTVKKTKEKLPQSQSKTSPERQSTLQMTLRSPRRSPKNKPCSLSSTQAVPTTPQRAKTSKKESIQTPTRLQAEEIIRECRIPLERLSLEEICQHDLQPTHHSTPVNVKFLSEGNDSRIIGLESHAAHEPTMPSDGWPKVLLNRMNIMATDADTSTSTSSPPRVSTTAYRPLDDYQSPQGSPHNSGLNTGDEPASVSQFFLHNIFTEVVDPD